MSRATAAARKNGARKKRGAFFGALGRFLTWLFASFVLVALVIGALFYRRADDEIARAVSHAFSASFPNLEVTVKSARLDATRGVRARDVEWRRVGSSRREPPLLAADEVYVEFRGAVRSLLSGNVSPSRVVISRPRFATAPTLEAVRENVVALTPLSNGRSPCSVDIYDGALLLQQDGGETLFGGVRLSLTPQRRIVNPPSQNAQDSADVAASATSDAQDDPEEQGAEFEDESDAAVARKSEDAPKDDEDDEFFLNDGMPQETEFWRIELEVSNPYVESLKLTGRASSCAWAFFGDISKIDLTALFHNIKLQKPEKVALVRDLQGKASLKFSVKSVTGSFGDAQYQIDGQAFNAVVAAPALKYPCSDVDATFAIKNGSLEITRASATCGMTTLKAAYRQLGSLLSPETSVARMKFENAPINDALLRSIANEAKRGTTNPPEEIDEFLNFIDDYQFSATTNIDLAFEKSPQTGGAWRPVNILFSGRNAEFTCAHFPYRLDGLQGVVSLDRVGTLTINLNSEDASNSTIVQGRFYNALTAPRGRIDVAAKNRAIDARLFAALNPDGREALAKLKPTGELDAMVRVAFDRAAFPDDPLKIEAALDVRDGSAQYEGFPLPITAISGRLLMRDGAWIFSNLTGRSGAAAITASGSLLSGKGYATLAADFARANAANSGGKSPFDVNSPAPPQRFTTVPALSGPALADDAWRFLLVAEVRNFPLGEELRAALAHYDRREDFERLRLEGKANAVVRVGYRTDDRRLGLQFDATPVPGSTSFQPVDLPLVFTDVEGRAIYREGVLVLDGFRAKNGAATYSANLRQSADANGGYVVDVSQLRVDQFQIDRDLQSAASPETQRFLEFLQPNGRFNVSGSMRIVKPGGANAKRRGAWELRVVGQQNSLRPGAAIDSICGRATTYGTFVEGATPTIYGELDVDSFYYKDVQVSNLTGPFFFNGTDFFWGREAPPIKKSPLYLDPFVKSKVDSSAFYQSLEATSARLQTPARGASIARGQSPAGFESEDGSNASQKAAEFYDATRVSEERGTTARSEYETLNGEVAAQRNVDASDLRPLRASVFNGAALSDGAVFVTENPSYRFTFDLRDGALDEASRVFAPGAKPLKGRVAARAALMGEGKNVAALKGEGNVRVQDAELYELPQIVKILQILSVKEPDKNAFNSSSVDFQVYGDRLKLTRVALEGDALSLFGDGWLTIRDQEKLIDLTFSTRLGSPSNQIPIVSDVFGAAGDQLARIRVEGNVASPIIQQDRLPGLKKAWWSVFPEQEPTPTDKAPVERSRPARDLWRKITGTEQKE